MFGNDRGFRAIRFESQNAPAIKTRKKGGGDLMSHGSKLRGGSATIGVEKLVKARS